MTNFGNKALAALRIFTGFAFLYAGWEKFSGSTPFTAAGFLTHATAGAVSGSAAGAIVNPTHDFWVTLGGNAALMPIVNALVMYGELAIGVALIFGLFTRFASLAGALMMIFITIAAWSFATGIFNETAMYTAICLFLAASGAGLVYGLDAHLPHLATLVRRHPEMPMTA